MLTKILILLTTVDFQSNFCHVWNMFGTRFVKFAYFFFKYIISGVLWIFAKTSEIWSTGPLLIPQAGTSIKGLIKNYLPYAGKKTVP